ncbi:putative structural/gag protein [Cryphonectria naterciae fusagravirus 1]|uniref:Structural/gag protein n=1 Tax=Cryphonectria naterciae fusagravirus 1 TaxID=2885715 RepID=A0AAE8Y976_9VIRU|nr:putative structural/gag protein [Cryphonectria naterciae fusagravirus 1]
MVDRLTGHVFLDRKPKQSVRHPRMMDSQQTLALNEAGSSASRSAVAQQTTIGRGCNLDSYFPASIRTHNFALAHGVKLSKSIAQWSLTSSTSGGRVPALPGVEHSCCAELECSANVCCGCTSTVERAERWSLPHPEGADGWVKSQAEEAPIRWNDCPPFRSMVMRADQSTGHPPVMDSYGYSALTEAGSSASRSAVAQQNTIGRDGNLDSHNIASVSTSGCPCGYKHGKDFECYALLANGVVPALTNYSPSPAIARTRQFKRAISFETDLTALVAAERSINLASQVKYEFNPACSCRINEVGSLVQGQCSVPHTLYQIPSLNRWCDGTTSAIAGGCYLALWSGWARPAVMRLLGRAPTAEAILHLLGNTHKCMRHDSWRFCAVRGGTEFVHILPDRFGVSGKTLLRAMPASSRVGFSECVVNTTHSASFTRYEQLSDSPFFSLLIRSLLISFVFSFVYGALDFGERILCKQIPKHFPTPRSLRKNGYCYLELFHPIWHPFVASLLGPKPPIRILRFLYVTLPFLFDFRVNFIVAKDMLDCDGRPVYHVFATTGGSEVGRTARGVLWALDADARLGQFTPSPEDQDTSSQLLAKSSVAVNAIAPLGGVRQVPTSLPIPQISPGFTRRWAPNIFPTSLTSQPLEWVRDAQGHLALSRESEFTYHYPEDSSLSRLPTRFSATLLSKWFFRREVDEAGCVTTAYNRRFEPDTPSRTTLDEFSAIGQVLDGNMSLDVLKDADAGGSFSRALGSRNQRLVPGWEAGVIPRWLQFRDFAIKAAARRAYKEFCFRVASRYTLATVASDVCSNVPEYERHVIDTTTDVQIIHINAEPIIAPPQPNQPPPIPQWGEAALWTPAMLQAVLDGRAQFIDGESYTREELAEIIACLAPSTHDNVPHLRRPVDPNDPDTKETMLPSCARYSYPNGVTHIIVHHGNAPLPSIQDQNWIAQHAFSFPSAMTLSTIIRSYSVRHSLEDLFVWAFEAVAYRSVGYTFADALGTNEPTATDDIIHASGVPDLFLPRNCTGFAYFDCFFVPVSTTPELESYLSAPTEVFVSSISLAAHFRAVSIAWGAKAGSLLGRVFNLAANQGNQFLRNHRTKWLRMFYGELNVWSALHANTMGFQYGFAPSPTTRRTESNMLPNWWRDYCTPTLVNHYLELWAMQVIPVFQVLPYYSREAKNSHVEWAPGTPDQTASLVSFNHDRKVRLAREVDVLEGHSWLGDGGAEYNSQFYYAQGNNGRFAYEGAQPKARFSFWQGSYARSFPVTPQAATPISLSNGRLNDPFADFILPGSFQSYRMLDDKIINWGVNEVSEHQLTNSEARRWWLASKGTAHVSLMVNYVSPISQHYELDDLADYSVTIWEKDGRFAALTFSNLNELLTKDNFNPTNIEESQKPFQTRFDSAPHRFEQLRPTRVTNNRSSHAKEARPALSSATDINRRIAELRRPQAGNITYETKYPLHADDLPKMNSYDVNVTKDGFEYPQNMAPNDLSFTPADRLKKIQEAQAHLDQQFQEYFAEQQQQQAINRTRLQANRVASPATTRPIAPVPRRKARLPSVINYPAPEPASYHKGRQSYVANKPLPPQPKPLVPNDAPAAGAQQAAIDLATLNARRGSLRPAVHTVQGRRSLSPRANYLQRRAHDTSVPDEPARLHHVRERPQSQPIVSDPSDRGAALKSLEWSNPKPFLPPHDKEWQLSQSIEDFPPLPEQRPPPLDSSDHLDTADTSRIRNQPGNSSSQVDLSQIDWNGGPDAVKASILDAFTTKASERVDMNNPKN